MKSENPFVPDTRLSLHGPLLRTGNPQYDEDSLYPGLGVLMQVAPDTVAFAPGHLVYGHKAIDFGGGCDIAIARSLDELKTARSQAVTRNFATTHPRTGENQIMVHFQMLGGFVPLGALRQDGSPHPAAGRGFLISVAIGYPDHLKVPTPLEKGPNVHRYMELYQLRFDGKQMHVEREPLKADLEPSRWIEDWICWQYGLSNAIPDGDDLLMGFICKKPGERRACGLSRWRFENDRWHFSQFIPLPDPDDAREPSLARDRDGALLFAVRGAGSDAPPGHVADGVENTLHHIRVYRSTDTGATWESVVHVPMSRAPTPVAAVQVHDDVHVFGNPYRPLSIDQVGKKLYSGSFRDQLCWWQLTDDRRSLYEPIVLLDTNQEFGEPRSMASDDQFNTWYVDHPVGGLFRLADGKWHSLLTVRVTDRAATQFGYAPTEHHGPCVIEFERPAPPKPVWMFAEDQQPTDAERDKVVASS